METMNREDGLAAVRAEITRACQDAGRLKEAETFRAKQMRPD